jgi:hypothetical protein
MHRRRYGLIVLVLGVLLTLGGLLADFLGAGGGGNLGPRQVLALLAGTGLAVAGIVLLRRPPEWRRPFASLGQREVVALLILGGIAALVYLVHLGTATWHPDELEYARAGRQYLAGDFDSNLEHPFLGKYVLGAAQALFGRETVLGVRGPGILAGLLTGAVLFAFGCRSAGFWAGFAAFALWALVEHPAGNAPIKLERFGLLDVFMGLFAAGALYAGWRWITTRDWRWVIATGVLAGLATGSKAPGVLVLVPLIFGGLFALGLSRNSLLQAATLLATCAVAALATYLPTIADAPDQIRYMFEFQSARTGHPVVVRGNVYDEPPWWANLWAQWEYLGPVSTVCLAALAVGAGWLLQVRLFVYLILAVLAPFVYLSFFSAFALTHYYYAWLPPLTLLAALCIHALYERRGRLRIVGVIATVPLAVVAGGTVLDVASLKPRDYPVAAEVLRDAGLDRGSVVVIGYDGVLHAYLPKLRLAKVPGSGTDAIVTDRIVARRARLRTGSFLGNPRAVARHLEGHRDEYELRTVDRLDVYVRRASLRRPRHPSWDRRG